MRVRPAATALLAVVVLGCGGRAAAPVASDPAQRPIVATTAPPAAPPEAAVPAIRLDVPSRAARHEAAPPADTPAPEVRHTLRRGQTLYSLARLYDVPVKELMAANGIANPRSIPAGAKILIPGARVPRPYEPAAAPGAGGSASGVGGGATGDGGGTTGDDPTHDDGSGGEAMGDDHGDGEPQADAGAARDETHAVRVDPSESLLWPLHGAITGPYGRRGRNGRHTGLDIDGHRGDPILAAASGVVLSAGTEGPYGRCVAIDHGDGMVTLYAHADRLLVRTGERVRAGQRIADVGRSGNARGTHLHFEVRRDGRTVDPTPFLRDAGLLTAGID